MSSQVFPTIDGVAPSWADIKVKLTPKDAPVLELIDIAGIKGSRKVDVGEQRGTSGGLVIATTTGSASQEASMTLYRSGYRKLLKALAAKAPLRGNQRRISLVRFNVLVQHTPFGETEIYEREFLGCRYLGDSDDMKEGTDADKLEITLNPTQIVDLIGGEEIVLL